MEQAFVDKTKKLSDKHWSNPIVDYLLKESLNDENLKKQIMDDSKSIEGMCDFIVKKASKQKDGGHAVVSDEDVFSWAIHYFIESNENIEKEVGKKPVKAVVNNNQSSEKSVKKEKQKNIDKDESSKLISIFDLPGLNDD
ncbi:MAG: Cas9 inhibitor AcrIIA9 family protein [Acholeplasmataceae bacterium]